MAKLMNALTTQPQVPAVTKVGGLPDALKGMAWPCCSACNGPMQFIAQIALPETGIDRLASRQQIILVFQCQNDPGMCEEWNSDAGGNTAIVLPISDLIPLTPPVIEVGRTVLDKPEFIEAINYDDSRHDNTSDDGYVEAIGAKGLSVVGKLGGHPLWIQGDETPNCACGKKMTFVAQISCSAGGGINFGDAGDGYVFVCASCDSKAKFLWQCF